MSNGAELTTFLLLVGSYVVVFLPMLALLVSGLRRLARTDFWPRPNCQRCE